MRPSHFSSDRNWIAVVAIAQNGVIGNLGALPWRLSSDLKRFKRLTMGQCLLMGRKTFESIGRPLPGRQTIVLSRSGFQTGALQVGCVRTPSEVPLMVEAGRQVMVVGGAQIYEATLANCSEIWLTRVLADITGDVRFPDIDWSSWQLVSSDSLPSGELDQWPTEFQIWRRVNTQEPLVDSLFEKKDPKA